MDTSGYGSQSNDSQVYWHLYQQAMGTSHFSSLTLELRHALRGLRRTPVYTVAAVLTLALGIGANAIAYTFLSAVFLRPMPFPHEEELVGISATHRAANGTVMDFAPSSVDYLAYATRSRTLVGVGAINSQNYALQGRERPETVLGATLTASMWSVLGTTPIAGRTFTADEDLPGSDVAVISQTLQDRLFPGSANSAVGQKITIDGVPRTVIGVMPRAFRPRMNPGDVWMPLGITDGNATPARQLQLVARMRRGLNLQTVRQDVIRVASELASERPATHQDWSASVTDLRAKVGDSARAVTMTIVAAVGFLLLLTCANVTNLALVRVARRASEISTRLALGASRSAVIRQQLAESMFVGLAGGVAGMVLAAAGFRPAHELLTTDNPLVASVSIDWRVLVMVFVMSTVAGLGCAVAPVLYALRIASGSVLSGAGRRQVIGKKERRIRRALMTVQVTAAAVLLIGAFGAVLTLRQLGTTNVGFASDNLFVASVTLPAARYPKTPERTLFVEQALARLRTTTGIEAAALTTNRFVPGQSTQGMFRIEGSTDENPVPAEVRRIDTAYFHAIGLSLKQGRAFEGTDRDSMPPVVIVNSAFVKQYLRDVEPLGARVKRGANPVATVVGVVPDVMDAGVGVVIGPMAYLPFAQTASASLAFVIRSKLPPHQVTRAVETAVASVDPGQPLDDVSPLNRLLADSLGEHRFKTLLLTVLSALALIVACIGIYGVTAYLIAERAKEVAIRIALGAAPREILAQFAADSGRWVLAGAIGGLAIAYKLAVAFGDRLPEVAAVGVGAYVGTGILLVAIGVLATIVPTLRVSRTPPATVLRTE